MISTNISKKNLYTTIEAGYPIQKYVKEWLERGEFDLEKNIAIINCDGEIRCFQEDEPKDKSELWDDEFYNFCDRLVEETQGYEPKGEDEADFRIFCGILPELEEMNVN